MHRLPVHLQLGYQTLVPGLAQVQGDEMSERREFKRWAVYFKRDDCLLCTTDSKEAAEDAVKSGDYYLVKLTGYREIPKVKKRVDVFTGEIKNSTPFTGVEPLRNLIGKTGTLTFEWEEEE